MFTTERAFSVLNTETDSEHPNSVLKAKLERQRSAQTSPSLFLQHRDHLFGKSFVVTSESATFCTPADEKCATVTLPIAGFGSMHMKLQTSPLIDDVLPLLQTTQRDVSNNEGDSCTTYNQKVQSTHEKMG